jgi:hypothetical protein
MTLSSDKLNLRFIHTSSAWRTRIRQGSDTLSLPISQISSKREAVIIIRILPLPPAKAVTTNKVKQRFLSIQLKINIHLFLNLKIRTGER